MRRLPTRPVGTSTLAGAFALALSLSPSGCDAGLTSPPLVVDEGLPDGLVMSIEVEPDEVHAHQPFVATFRIRNVTLDPIQVTTPHSCLVVPGVYRNGERVPFEGSGYGCLTVISTHTFEPGETRTRTWEMRAEFRAQAPGEPDGLPAPPGTYLVRAEFEFTNEDGERPGAGALLRVR